ncbi:MAG: VOC family protein [Pseudomonadota bacterium]
MSQHETIDYLEFSAPDLVETKRFFEQVFNWEFVDYGPDYTSFSCGDLNGGFFRAEQVSKSDTGGALVVFYSDDLPATQAKIERAGGVIVKPTFEFPGGRRFHFTEPSGNEFAVWTESGAP